MSCSSSSAIRRRWVDPEERTDTAALTASDIDVFVHAPYRINVATMNNRIRIPSRKLLFTYATAAATVGAKGLIVHGGHVEKPGDIGEGHRQLAQDLRVRGRERRLRHPDPDREHRRRRQRLRPPARRAGQAVGRGGRVRCGLLPRHLPRPRRRRGTARHRRQGEGHHRPHRPDPRQRLARPVRLRGATAMTTSATARSIPISSLRSSGPPAPRSWSRRRAAPKVKVATSRSCAIGWGEKDQGRTHAPRAGHR